MGRHAKDTGGGDFQDAPIGTHVAGCIRLIDLGTQHSTYQGEPTVRNQVLVTWELPHEKMEDGRPFTVSAFLTNSLSEKATMRHWLENWRGRPFTPEELNGFDLQNILGAYCMLNVIAKPEGKKGVKVGGVMALPKGMEKPKLENELSAFWLDEFHRGRFEELPKGIKAIIEQSDEYKAMMDGPASRAAPPSGGGTFNDLESDIPFMQPFHSGLWRSV